jgi:hypothetical protein
MIMCICWYEIKLSIQATFTIAKYDKTSFDKGTSPFHNRTSQCSTRYVGRVELGGGGPLAQVTADRHVLEGKRNTGL